MSNLLWGGFSQLSQNDFLSLTDEGKSPCLKSHDLCACNFMLTNTDSNHTKTANSHRPRVLSVAFLSLPISFQKTWMTMERQCGQKRDTVTERSLREGNAWFHIPFRWFPLPRLCSITSSRKTVPDAASSSYSRYLGKQFFLSACKGSTIHLHHHGEKKQSWSFPRVISEHQSCKFRLSTSRSSARFL